MTTSVKNYIHCLIMAVFMIGSFFIPGQGTITDYGMKVIGIFLGMMWGWLFLDLTFPSIAGLCVLAIAGYGTAQATFMAGIGSEVVLVVILFTTFTAYITKTGLSNVIVDWFLSRKIIKGRPYVFVTLFWILTFVLGILVDIYPTIFILWPVLYSISTDLGYGKGDKFPSYMCFGVTFIGGVGATCKPFSMWGLTGYGVFEAATGIHIDYLQYTVYTGIVSIVVILIYALLVPKLISIDFTTFKEGQYQIKKVEFDTEKKIAGIFTIVLFIVLYLPSVLPENWALTAVLKSQLGTVGCVAVLLCLLGMIQKKEGGAFVKIDELSHSGVPFNMVFMVSATIVIGGALKSEDTGIVTAITETLTPMLSHLSPIIFYLVLIVVYGLTTQFLHNAALLTVFTPIACTLAEAVGANVIITFMCGMIMLSTALMTPAASTRSGLVFSNDWIEKKQAYFLGAFTVVATGIVFFVVGIPLGAVMFPGM